MTIRRLDIGVYGGRGIPSTYGGYETFLTVMLPALARRGHRVTMYCRRGHVAGEEPYEGVRRVVLPALPWFRLETISHGLPAGLAARLQRHDVVFVVNIANVPYCMLARASGQRMILNTDGQEWIRGKWGRRAQSYWRQSARLAAGSASALVTDCNAMRDIYRLSFGAESTVIPYCWTELAPAGDPAEVLSTHGVEPYRYLLVAARLNPENNVAEIARAYARSDASYPLLVLGDANYPSPVYGEVEAIGRQRPQLRIAGHVDDRQAFATLLTYSAAYIHGHRVGGINPSLIEAMGCGANILALDTPFNQEALGPNGSFFHDFTRELPELLAAVQAEAISSAQSSREKARRRAQEVFGLDAVVDAHEALFAEVARRPPWAKTSMPTRWSEE